MIDGPMKIMARKILGVLANSRERLFTDREIVEELKKLGIGNETLVKKTIMVLANKKGIIRYKDEHKRNRFYSVDPAQKQLNDYFA